MGMLWLSVAPLVSGLVAEMFGTRYMATLLGIAFVMHQVGSSLGAWGGGLIFDWTGNYDYAWKIGVLIGFAAGVVQIFAGGAAEHDRDASHPTENYRRLRDEGFLALNIGAEWGGQGVGLLGHTIAF